MHFMYKLLNVCFKTHTSCDEKFTFVLRWYLQDVRSVQEYSEFFIL